MSDKSIDIFPAHFPQVTSSSMTNQQPYQPSPAMRVWLDSALRLMTDNITEIAEDCKVSRQSWYEWLKSDDFRLWFKTEWDKRLAGEAWKLDTIGMKQAKRDFKYWEGMQRRVGNLTDNPQNIVNVGMKVEFE